jgi:hypothetical protein
VPSVIERANSNSNSTMLPSSPRNTKRANAVLNEDAWASDEAGAQTQCTAAASAMHYLADARFPRASSVIRAAAFGMELEAVRSGGRLRLTLVALQSVRASGGDR